MKSKDTMKNTQLTLTISAIMMLLSMLTMMMPTSGSVVPSRAPAFGQEEDLGNFSIMNTTELNSGGANTSRTFIMPQQQGEEATSPPSSEAPRSEAPQSEAPQSEP
jgi:hypothetical protein